MIIYSQHIKGSTRRVSDCYRNDEQRFGATHSFLDDPQCWCPAQQQKITGQYLEITLPKEMLVTKIVTQGKNMGNWVSIYRVEYCKDDNEWIDAGEYEGNTDPITKVAQEFVKVARKIRIYPVSYHDFIDFRADIIVNTNNQVNQQKKQIQQAIPKNTKPSRLVKGTIRSCSQCYDERFDADQSYLEAPNGWAPHEPGDFLQITFPIIVSVLQIVSHSKCGLTIQYERDQTWVDAGTIQGGDEINQIQVELKTHSLRFLPLEAGQVHVEAYVESGTETEQKDPKMKLSCELPGAKRYVSDCFQNAEQQFGAQQSFLDAPRAWCPMDQQNVYDQYIQIDLGQRMQVVEIITQGRTGCCWVTKYRVEYRDGNGKWQVFGELEGNVDNVNKAKRRVGFIATQVRLYPIEYHNYIDMRADILVTDDLTEKALQQQENDE